jgi:hypothetical protein
MAQRHNGTKLIDTIRPQDPVKDPVLFLFPEEYHFYLPELK